MFLPFSFFTLPIYGHVRGAPNRDLEIFPGTMPPQRSVRRENCLSAKREFFPGSEASLKS